MNPQPGLRVVRGFDWRCGDQDGGEGMVGTVIDLKQEGQQANDLLALVMWDNGNQGRYRCGYQNAQDLLVFTTGSITSKHGVGCDTCLRDIHGMRWCCNECPLTNYCTTCYMADKHDTGHAFMRFETSDVKGTLVKNRNKVMKKECKGFFPGSIVVRGKHWECGDQDGGSTGILVDLKGWDTKPRKCSATVKWNSTGDTKVYRTGYNNKFDISCTQAASGGFYYKDNLPALGQVLVTKKGPKSYANAVGEVSGSGAGGGGSQWDVGAGAGGSMYPDINHSGANGRRDTWEQEGTTAINNLISASKMGDMEQVKNIISDHPQDIDAFSMGETPLMAAILEERNDVVFHLVKSGADVNITDKNDYTAVHLALSVGNVRNIESVFAAPGINPNHLFSKRKLSYLQYAAICGSLRGTQIVLERFPMLRKHYSGPSPLHYAIISSMGLVEFLIKEGGYDVDTVDPENRTPLHLALITGQLMQALSLIKYSANINLADDNGNNCLHLAVNLREQKSLREDEWYNLVMKRYLGKRDVVKAENAVVLKQMREELFMGEDDPTMTACTTMAHYLVNLGANIQFKNKEGFVPLDVCSRSSTYHELLKLSQKVKVMPSMDATPECRLCREIGTNGKFEPCGHNPTCYDCALYFDRCFQCESKIVAVSKITEEAITDCLICDDNVADILLLPCKHIVVCTDCVWRMKRCVYCKTFIDKKLFRDGRPYEKPKVTETRYDVFLDSLKDLREKVQQIEVQNICTVCLDKEKNVVFDCGHGSCDVCSESMKFCPICRRAIDKRIKVFQ